MRRARRRRRGRRCGGDPDPIAVRHATYTTTLHVIGSPVSSSPADRSSEQDLPRRRAEVAAEGVRGAERAQRARRSPRLHVVASMDKEVAPKIATEGLGAILLEMQMGMIDRRRRPRVGGARPARARVPVIAPFDGDRRSLASRRGRSSRWCRCGPSVVCRDDDRGRMNKMKDSYLGVIDLLTNDLTWTPGRAALALAPLTSAQARGEGRDPAGSTRRATCWRSHQHGTRPPALSIVSTLVEPKGNRRGAHRRRDVGGEAQAVGGARRARGPSTSRGRT